MVEKIVISIKQLNFYRRAMKIENLLQNLMTNNSLFIDNESGDIFCQNFNTGKNFYNFIVVQ